MLVEQTACRISVETEIEGTSSLSPPSVEKIKEGPYKDSNFSKCESSHPMPISFPSSLPFCSREGFQSNS